MNALQLLRGRDFTGGDGQYQTQCPAHDDSTASLSVAQRGSRLLLFCHAGCTFLDIYMGFGLGSGALIHNLGGEPSPSSPPPPKVELPPLCWGEILPKLTPMSHKSRQWLEEERCISPQVQEEYGLHWFGNRIAIPIYDRDMLLRDVRLWLPPSERTKDTPKITSWKRGYGGSKLYPIGQSIENEILLVGGELDALALRSIRSPAITTTGSEGSFPASLAVSLADMGVVKASVLLDNDKTGAEGTTLRINRLRDAGIEATPHFWPHGKPRGWDAIDELKRRGTMRGVL